MMKFAIIAAGDGSRLAQEGIQAPKPLVKVGNERLLDRLIRIFMANNASEIVVICNAHMSEVANHLRQIKNDGLNGKQVPLRYIIKSTPSSMHSLYELSSILGNEPFVLTTVDTIFNEDAFKLYISNFSAKLSDGVEAFMGVTDYIDDEKPLYVGVDNYNLITGYFDHPQEDTHFISAGIYGLTSHTLPILDNCIQNGEGRMRNFQRALVAANLNVQAYDLGKVFDIDHAEDIEKANDFIHFHSDFKSAHDSSYLLVQRAKRFSPNSSEKDLAILEEVGKYLDDYILVDEEHLTSELQTVPYIFSMARSESALLWLQRAELRGSKIINSSTAVRRCQRSSLIKLMKENSLPIPPKEGDKGYWVKRGDASAEIEADIVYCRTVSEREEQISNMKQRNITDIVIQAHIPGDLIKFYGVSGTNFFRIYYPTDDNETKFGDEQHNGIAHHYNFSIDALKSDVEKLSQLTQCRIYGGDAIIQGDGSYYIIDFNDWPSFSRCRQEAGLAISSLISLNQ